MVPAHSHKVPRVSWYSGYCLASVRFAYGAFTHLAGLSSSVLLQTSIDSTVRTPDASTWFGLFRVRSPLLTESHVVFSSSAYLDVSVQRVPGCTLWIHVQSLQVFCSRFPHSEIRGSKVICTSPRLFAAYHVFHRLLVPRHPPCALDCLISQNM